MQDMKPIRWPYGVVKAFTVQGAANGLCTGHVVVWLQATAESAGPGETPQALPALQRLGGALEVVNFEVANTLEADATAPHKVPGSAQQVYEQAHLWVHLVTRALNRPLPLLAPRVAGQPKIEWGHNGSGPGIWIVWPTYWPGLLAGLLTESLDGWYLIACGPDNERDVRRADPCDAEVRVREGWLQRTVAAKQSLPTGKNPANLLAAARSLSIPAVWVDREVLQLGHGRRARWWRSTVTDATPWLGVALARDKTRTSRLLKAAGIPVPIHVEVRSLAQALQAAETVGYPLVVKPADQELGNGARANLATQEQVAHAYGHAVRHSNRILVEQHIHGREYRLTVVNGELIWAHERVPAQIVGDGIHSIEALITQENTHRRAALSVDPTGWVPIQMDGDAKEYLQQAGWTLQSVPEAGQTVRLQRVPAATTGGGGQPCFDTLHPDNRQLAERAARLLRLDIAGVDLIMSDITRSWRDVGGAITEVNAMPQVSLQTNPKLIQRLLEKTMPEGGRIPTIVVLGQQMPDGLVQTWRQCFQQAGLCLGYSTLQGMGVALETHSEGLTSAWDHVRALQLDPRVDALLLGTDGVEFLKSGLPFDRIDLLVVLDPQPRGKELMTAFCTGLHVTVDVPSTQTEPRPAKPERTMPLSGKVKLDLKTVSSVQWIRAVMSQMGLRLMGPVDGA